MQAWVFENMTDFWGDIPYSETLQGDLGGPLKPKYDKQQDIYTGLLKTVTDAAASMKTGTTDPALGNGDPIYKGNIANWQKLANSLHARMAMRIIKADAAKATAELAAAFSGPGGVMTSNADNAKLVFDCYGDHYYFAQAQMAGDSTTLAAVRSKAEHAERLALAKVIRKSVVVIVAG